MPIYSVNWKVGGVRTAVTGMISGAAFQKAVGLFGRLEKRHLDGPDTSAAVGIGELMREYEKD